MQSINVTVSKTDTIMENLSISCFDSTIDDPSVDVVINYNTLDAGQKATADAFLAMAVSLIPA
jgi:hypothetical protein